MTPVAGNDTAMVITGSQLRAALNSAANLLGNQAPEINALNVFPVPDGDTGSNMWMTLQSAVAAVNELPDDARVGEVARALSHGALMGARGNSGVILSQILRGLARSLDDMETSDASQLAAALSEGSATAYRAVIKPVEGTILTVARESAAAAVVAAAEHVEVGEVLLLTLQAAQASLERTPELLPVLAQAGVVDAGGKGLVTFLDGLRRYFDGRGVSLTDTLGTSTPHQVAVFQPLESEDEFGYCTEFLVMGEQIDIDALREQMVAIGTSVLVVGDETTARVHLHLDQPGDALTAAQRFGSLHKIKVDNMQEQHRQLIFTEPVEPQLPESNHANATIADDAEVVVSVVAVASGAGINDIFHSLGATGVVPGGQTMNPSTGEILQVVEACSTKDVIILPNNSNIVLTAEQAVPLTGKNLAVVPTRTIPQGIAAMMAYNFEAGLEANVASMNASLARVRTLEIATAVRDANVDGIEITAGQYIALLDDRMVGTGPDLEVVTVDALRQAGTDNAELITVYHGEPSTAEAAASLTEQLSSLFPESSVETVAGGQPHYHYIISVE